MSMETVDEIIGAMREWATGEGCFNDDPGGASLLCVYWAQQPFLTMCDRLEAAAKRERHNAGDQAANRDYGSMNLQQALKWADDNTQPEAVDRLRSRAVAKVLAATVRKYAAWIREEGERNNTCTFNVMGEVCGYCECKRKPSNAN